LDRSHAQVYIRALVQILGGMGGGRRRDGAAASSASGVTKNLPKPTKNLVIKYIYVLLSGMVGDCMPDIRDKKTQAKSIQKMEGVKKFVRREYEAGLLYASTDPNPCLPQKMFMMVEKDVHADQITFESTHNIAKCPVMKRLAEDMRIQFHNPKNLNKELSYMGLMTTYCDKTQMRTIAFLKERWSNNCIRLGNQGSQGTLEIVQISINSLDDLPKKTLEIYRDLLSEEGEHGRSSEAAAPAAAAERDSQDVAGNPGPSSAAPDVGGAAEQAAPEASGSKRPRPANGGARQSRPKAPRHELNTSKSSSSFVKMPPECLTLDAARSLEDLDAAPLLQGPDAALFLEDYGASLSHEDVPGDWHYPRAEDVALISCDWYWSVAVLDVKAEANCASMEAKCASEEAKCVSSYRLGSVAGLDYLNWGLAENTTVCFDDDDDSLLDDHQDLCVDRRNQRFFDHVCGDQIV